VDAADAEGGRLRPSGRGNMAGGHTPVMLATVLRVLAPRPGERILDATLGLGGHARALLEASAPDGRLWGMDADPEAIRRASEALKGPVDSAEKKPAEGRFTAVHGNFRDLDRVCGEMGIDSLDVILMDLGVSSMQLDEASRGFSFRADAPLDMRLDQTAGRTAAELVNSESEEDLADLIYRFGEERKSRRIASAIAAARREAPIVSTARLAEIVVRAVRPDRKMRTHPATRTFMALRIAVNGEMEALELGAGAALKRLAPGGRLGIISFMSLEDRIVKNAFRGCDGAGFEVITKKPIIPTEDEVRDNRRARSAKFRAIRKRKQGEAISGMTAG
jgi:16S rRNA (cytosine1402-N4)-methyltransferase